MYHIYKNGYNTLPNLRKIEEKEVFEKNNEDSKFLQLEKKEALKNQKYFFEYNVDPDMYFLCYDFILKNYPYRLSGKNYLEIAQETNEDFLIHRIDGDKDYLCSAHICFPSHWNPEDKIGLNFEEIHKPVPMNLKNSFKLIHAAVYGGIFERFVWSVVHENKYNFHPRFKNKKFNANDPKVLIKVERQVTIGFPKNHFCLFILRQYLIPEESVDKKSLVCAIENMDEKQKEYKGLLESKDLIDYLKKEI